MNSTQPKKSATQYIGVQQSNNVVSVKLSLVAEIIEEEPGCYLAVCPALELSTQGDSIAEAEANIHEAVGLFIEACIEDKMLGKVLTDCGFYEVADATTRKRKTRKMPSMQNRDVLHQITVPAELPVMMHDCR